MIPLALFAEAGIEDPPSIPTRSHRAGCTQGQRPIISDAACLVIAPEWTQKGASLTTAHSSPDLALRQTLRKVFLNTQGEDGSLWATMIPFGSAQLPEVKGAGRGRALWPSGGFLT